MNSLHMIRMARFLAIGVSLVTLMVMAASGVAAETGVLKLKVARCDGGQWIDDAQVDVIIYRPGVGTVDSNRGQTNSAGYLQLTFTDLEVGDEARTTVTPDGETSDPDHTYVWTAGVGDQTISNWDLEAVSSSGCADDWYDENNRIFECFYE